MFLYFHLFHCLSREAEEPKKLLLPRCLICIKRGQEEGEEGRGPEAEFFDIIGEKVLLLLYTVTSTDVTPSPRAKVV
jgi:hypothetical protein